MPAFFLYPELFSFKGDPERLRPPGTWDRSDERTGGSRILCPLCSWEPARSDRWACSCDFLWNTFDTGGVCPACDHRWLETMCHRCLQWSPHAEWYVDPPPAD